MRELAKTVERERVMGEEQEGWGKGERQRQRQGR